MKLEKLIKDKIDTAIKEVFETKRDEIEKKINDRVDKLQFNVKANIKEFKPGKLELHHKDLDKIYKLVQTKFPVYIYGEAGVGKTHLCQQIANLLKVEFYGTGAIQDSYKLLGYKDSNGNYQETEFYKAFKDGGLFLFDEMDASSSEALVAINSALANGFVDFPNGRIYKNENFYCIGAGNSNGVDTERYTARNELDASTLDRFIFVEMDYDKNLEFKLIKDNELCKVWHEIRRVVKEKSLNILVSTRTLIIAKTLIDNNICENNVEVVKMTVLKGQKPELVKSILNEIKY